MALKCQGMRSEGNAAAIAIPVHGDSESLGNFGSRALSLGSTEEDYGDSGSTEEVDARSGRRRRRWWWHCLGKKPGHRVGVVMMLLGERAKERSCGAE
ncbi:Os11g0649350 [Oryza sativa Japonica Group]|uniref:Os11g0649350 protein n=1 Tax=Oryza sativa subsp. japonica TaxID=39947 RepID=A0A0P0Y570_ORYSJ|nr:Os11g0649350 [Oryza sativa Japonica Group]